MIQINKHPGQRILELGGGDNPHPDSTVRVDVRQGPHTHFTANFEEPLTSIGSDEFDGLLCFFCLEHISYRKVPQFLAECCRVLKPGARAVMTLPNTQAQLKWLAEHPEGWDGRSLFDAAGGLLFGDLDYPENGHKAYFSPALAIERFTAAGFINVLVQPYGERATDLLVTAERPHQPTHVPVAQTPPEHPQDTREGGEVAKPSTSEATTANPQGLQSPPPETIFDRAYFNGGGKWGGYAREGMWDFPVHNVTAQHVLQRHPSSVLELGAARGYLGKRIEDAGIPYLGLEVSRHCWLTRVSENVRQHNILQLWPVETWKYDLCFSCAVLEHIPEANLPALLAEMCRTCKRGLHGIDFGHNDDSFDKSHCTLRPYAFWLEAFNKYAPGWPVEIVDKEDLERGQFPEAVLKGDGKLKLNLGSCMTCFHHGWQNLDVLDLGQWAQQYGYQYQRCDLRAGLPYATGTVDLLFAHHVLEHFTYEEGLNLLRECRRVLKPEGAMRLAVPDLAHLATWYRGNGHSTQFDELNENCARSDGVSRKFWELAVAGHAAGYDVESLMAALMDAGFSPVFADFRQTHVEPCRQILRETVEMTYGGLSLFMDAVPRVGG